MKVYEISLADRVFELIPITAPTERLSSCASDAARIYFYPTRDCDFKIDVEYENVAGPMEIFAVLSFFFGQVRGLPECELLMTLNGKVTELKILDTPHGFATVRLDKCKQLSAKRCSFSDGTEHNIYTVLAGEALRCILADDIRRFDASVLQELLIMKGLPDVGHAIAVSSISDGPIPARAEVIATDGTPIYAAASAAALVASRGCETITVNGTVCSADIRPDGSVSVHLPAHLDSVRDE